MRNTEINIISYRAAGDMEVEIERRFLVGKKPPFLTRLNSHDIEQWYPPDKAGLNLPPEAEDMMSNGLRIRRKNTSWIATIKGPWEGISRVEFEWDIQAMECSPEWPCISKTRYLWPDPSGLIWEIDVFHGRLNGLVIAEVELPTEYHPIDIPSWTIGEVTGERGWSNAELANSDFSEVCKSIVYA